MKLSLVLLFAAGCTGSAQVTATTTAPPPQPAPQPVVVASAPAPAPAPPPPAAEPVAHPHYMHALSDLRAARGYLHRPARATVKWDENRAIREIDAAINEIKRASIDDGKNIDDHPPVDNGMVWGNRLQKALELVETARRDVGQAEDNGFANGLKNRAVGHIDLAARAIHDGMTDARVQPLPPPPVVVEQPAPPPPVAVAHPHYMHALSDLRAARGYLHRPARTTVKWDENRAIREIDAAINEIKHASIDDGKNVDDHPPVDDGMVWGNRLQKALELVETAQRDVNQAEDNGFANGLKNRAVGHIELAARAIHDGMADAHVQPGGPPPAVVEQPAPSPTAHPAYLHALSDLRHVRALLEKPAHPEVKWDENTAIREVDAAINEIKHASIDDGKPLSDHPAIDVHLGHRDRLKRAEEMLHKAASDIESREDNAWAQGLRGRAVGHIRQAEHAVHDAMEMHGH
ncbi:MAG TPA: hypothetical protein VGG74_28335 [Kofleriaceae bacterium]